MPVLTLEDLCDNIINRLENGYQIKDCLDLLEDYRGTDYIKGIHIDDRKYNRHVVFKSDELELVIMTWAPNQASGFHGHPGECIFKVLEGIMLEDLIDRVDGRKLSVFKQGDCGYIDNSIGRHNVYTDEGAVSLHIYSPPFIR